MLKRLWIVCFFMGLLPLSVACAHDINIITYNTAVMPVWQLVSSSPADNALINGAPHSVNLTFSQNIDPDKSGLRLYDPYNNPVKIEVSVKGFSMTATPPPLATGTYRAEWNASCLCTGVNALQGIIRFTVQ